MPFAALMTSKACLSSPHSPAPVLGVTLLCPQPKGPQHSPPRCSSGDLESPGSTCVPFPPISEEPPVGSYPSGNWDHTVKAFPPSCSSDELVSLVGSIGQEAPWQQQEQSTTLRLEALGLDRDARPQAESVLSKAQSSPTGLLILLVPLPFRSPDFVTSEASCSTEKRMYEKSQGWTVAWGGREGWGLQSN